MSQVLIEHIDSNYSTEIASDLCKLDYIIDCKSNWTLDQWKAEIANESVVIYCLKVNQKLSGLLCSSYSFEICQIHKFGVIPSMRNKKMGRLLLEQLISLQQDKKFNIILEVKENNFSARHLYEKVKFRVLGERKNYYADGSKAIVYEKK